MGKRELENKIFSTEEVSKVIEFIVFGISNNFISRRTPFHWEKAVDEFHRCKSCGITYFKRPKEITYRGAIIVNWQGFSPDELTPPTTGRDVCWNLNSDLACFLEAIYEFKTNHL